MSGGDRREWNALPVSTRTGSESAKHWLAENCAVLLKLGQDS